MSRVEILQTIRTCAMKLRHNPSRQRPKEKCPSYEGISSWQRRAYAALVCGVE
jgi:hypothetical protein